jgi:hypothetical protein
LYSKHRFLKGSFCCFDFLLLFFLIPAVYLVPFVWVFGHVVLFRPGGDIPSDEGAPEFGIFAFDLRAVDLDLVELLRGVYPLEDAADLEVFQMADVCET